MMNTESFRSIPPPVSAITDLSLPSLRTRILSSGIKILIYDKCDADVTYISVVTPGGQSESLSPAVATLNAILHREGSQSYSGQQIAEILDNNGAWISSVPSPHHTRHALYTLNATLPNVMPVFTDMVFYPTFPHDAVQMRKESLASNIETSQSDVNYLAHCLSDAMIMGPAHPLARTDTPEFVRGITSGQLFEFHSLQFEPKQTHVYLCGKITPDVEDTVAKALSGLSLPSHHDTHIATHPFNPIPAGSIRTVHRPEASQCAVVITLPAVPRTHPDYIPLHLTVLALGGYFGSRLMTNIRENKGLTYGIHSSLMGYPDGAHVEISAETDNSTVKTLIDEVSAELDRLASMPCSGSELTRMKRAATSTLISILDSPFTIMDHHITMHTSGIPSSYFADKLKWINRITPDIIAETAAKYLTPRLMRTAIAGNISDTKFLHLND